MKRMVAFMLCAVIMLFTACSSEEKTVVKNEPANNETELPEISKEEKIAAEESAYYLPVKKILESGGESGLEIPVVECSEEGIRMDDGVVQFSGKAVVDIKSSIGYPFAVLSSKMKNNPFAAFNLLIENDLYVPDKTNEEKSTIEFNFASDSNVRYVLNEKLKETAFEKYPYTQEGCSAFVSKIGELLMDFEGGGNMLLDNYDVAMPVYYSEEDECYYGYKMFYSTSLVNMLAMYIRSDGTGYITDVEFQILSNLYPSYNYAAGVGISWQGYDNKIKFEVVSVMSCIEKLLADEYFFEGTGENDFTGKSYPVPAKYAIGDFEANLNRNVYHNGENEKIDECVLYTYRIKKAG